MGKIVEKVIKTSTSTADAESRTISIQILHSNTRQTSERIIIEAQ
jgi:hypothetical protein